MDLKFPNCTWMHHIFYEPVLFWNSLLRRFPGDHGCSTAESRGVNTALWLAASAWTSDQLLSADIWLDYLDVKFSDDSAPLVPGLGQLSAVRLTAFFPLSGSCFKLVPSVLVLLFLAGFSGFQWCEGGTLWPRRRTATRSWSSSRVEERLGRERSGTWSRSGGKSRWGPVRDRWTCEGQAIRIFVNCKERILVKGTLGLPVGVQPVWFCTDCSDWFCRQKNQQDQNLQGQVNDWFLKSTFL